MPHLEDKEYFAAKPLPDCLSDRVQLDPNSPIASGREAYVRRVTDSSGKHYAYKWYASLSDQPVEDMVNYALEVRRDENELLKAGLNSQLLLSHYFIGEDEEKKPQLFATQRWIEGRTLKKIPVNEVMANRRLRQSIAHLFLCCARVFENCGQLPDLTGGDRISVLGKEIPDPRKIIWPLYTNNIMVSGDKAYLNDAHCHSTHPGTLKYQMILFTRMVSIGLGDGLWELNAWERLSRARHHRKTSK